MSINLDLFIIKNVVKAPNKAINCTVNEKIRRYNNSAVYLMNYLEILIQKEVYGNIIVDYCKGVFSDADNKFRMIVRSICLEMFVLREKIYKYSENVVQILNCLLWRNCDFNF